MPPMSWCVACRTVVRSSVVVIALGSIGGVSVHAQAPAKPAASTLPVRPSQPARAEQGPTWASLKPTQRTALAPLERDWAGIDSLGKRKWLEIAERYPAMPAPEQARLQARMTEWTRLTPAERGEARLNYQQAKQAPVQDKQASWEAYQALPAEQRRELADRAAPAASATSRPAIGSAAASSRSDAQGRPPAKSNSVADPASAASPKPVAPVVVQAKPGATTTLISKQPVPPAHQQTGMPKIAATPEFIDKKTLLPQAGAQSAQAAAASAPPTRP